MFAVTVQFPTICSRARHKPPGLLLAGNTTTACRRYRRWWLVALRGTVRRTLFVVGGLILSSLLPSICQFLRSAARLRGRIAGGIASHALLLRDSPRWYFYSTEYCTYILCRRRMGAAYPHSTAPPRAMCARAIDACGVVITQDKPSQPYYRLPQYGIRS